MRGLLEGDGLDLGVGLLPLHQVHAQVLVQMDGSKTPTEGFIKANTDNPHCHIVYNRINNEGKLISDRNDYRRNEQVTKALKSKYGLTYGTDKSNTNTRKLRNAERAKYEIHNAVKDALKVADSWQKFKNELAKRGVCLELVYKDRREPRYKASVSARMDIASKVRRLAEAIALAS